MTKKKMIDVTVILSWIENNVFKKYIDWDSVMEVIYINWKYE